MNECRFGVEQRGDGSAVVTAPSDEDTRVVVGHKRAASTWERVRARTAKSLHVWVVAAAGADLVRTAAWTRSTDPFHGRVS